MKKIPLLEVSSNSFVNNPTTDLETKEKTPWLECQLVKKLENVKTYKKGATKLFRLMFTSEEIRGRSLTGSHSPCPWGQKREPLENQEKIIQLRETIKKKWPETTDKSINQVLRDILKPSRQKDLEKN